MKRSKKSREGKEKQNETEKTYYNVLKKKDNTK